jgi:hypothetical protein
MLPPDFNISERWRDSLQRLDPRRVISRWSSSAIAVTTGIGYGKFNRNSVRLGKRGSNIGFSAVRDRLTPSRETKQWARSKASP